MGGESEWGLMGYTFLDLFAGIGGFRFGMQRAGHKPIGWVENNKFARISYQAIHDTQGEWTADDITTVTNESIRRIGHTDVICGGFPCQAFSIAGKRAGFNDTRGTLFFEIMRFASILRPRYLFLENVEGLLSHNNGDTFETILRTMDEVGYDAEWNVCNSKNFGVPQNRARVFIIGHLRGASTRKVFPLGRENGGAIEVVGRLNIKGKDCIKRVYGVTGISPALTTMQGGSQEPKVLIAGNSNPSGKGMNGNVFNSLGLAPTLTTNKGEGNKVLVRQRKSLISNEQKIMNRYRIRKLTPRECWRLQGFPDEAFDKARAAGVSDSQLYKQAGNSVTINVIEEIAKSL